MSYEINRGAFEVPKQATVNLERFQAVEDGHCIYLRLNKELLLAFPKFPGNAPYVITHPSPTEYPRVPKGTQITITIE